MKSMIKSKVWTNRISCVWFNNYELYFLFHSNLMAFSKSADLESPSGQSVSHEKLLHCWLEFSHTFSTHCFRNVMHSFVIRARHRIPQKFQMCLAFHLELFSSLCAYFTFWLNIWYKYGESEKKCCDCHKFSCKMHALIWNVLWFGCP